MRGEARRWSFDGVDGIGASGDLKSLGSVRDSDLAVVDDIPVLEKSRIGR